MATKGKQSAGILAYRESERGLEVFLVHPGGPLWAKKDDGAWSIPKGEKEDGDEDMLETAKREFAEETGQTTEGEYDALTPVKMKSGKTVYAYAVNYGGIDATAIKSNKIELEWPPRTGKKQEFPEVDRGAWMDKETAMRKIVAAQAAFLTEIEQKLKESRKI